MVGGPRYAFLIKKLSWRCQVDRCGVNNRLSPEMSERTRNGIRFLNARSIFIEIHL